VEVHELVAHHDSVRAERYRHPEPLADPSIKRLEKVSFNHVCFAVDDIEAEVARLNPPLFHPSQGCPFRDSW